MGTSQPTEPTDSSPVESPSTPDLSPIDPLFVAAGLGVLGPILAIVLALPVVVLTSFVGLSLLVSVVLLLVTGQYLAFGGLALWYLRSRGLGWGDVRSYLGIEVPGIRDLITVVAGYVVIFVLVVIINQIVLATGVETGSNQSAELAVDNPELFILLIPAMFLVVGPCEEILYRGVVQSRLREHFGSIVSIALASAIFAAVHVVALTGGASARLATVTILFFPSLVFGAVYEYSDNLVVPALLHAIHNSIILLALYALVVAGDGSMPQLLLPALG